MSGLRVHRDVGRQTRHDGLAGDDRVTGELDRIGIGARHRDAGRHIQLHVQPAGA
jgi:hypothetical protein